MESSLGRNRRARAGWIATAVGCLLAGVLVGGPAAAQPAGNLAFQHPFQVGLGGSVSLVEESDDGVTAIGLGGLELGYTFLPNWSAGMTRLHLNAVDILGKTRWGWGFGAFGEVFTFPLDWLQPYGRAGLLFQHRAGADVDARFGLLPYLSGGARGWATDWFSIGLEVQLQVVAVDGFLFSSNVMPPGAVVSSISFNFDFHLGRRPQ